MQESYLEGCPLEHSPLDFPHLFVQIEVGSLGLQQSRENDQSLGVSIL